MSVRIYQLSKELEMSNKEVIALLQERGHEVKSASSTIANIYAEAILEEFGKDAKAQDKPEVTKEEPAKEEEPKAQEPQGAAPKVVLPQGAVVKSAQDVHEETAPKKDLVKPAPVKPLAATGPKAPPMPGAAPKAPAMPSSAGSAPSAPKIPQVTVNIPPKSEAPAAPAAPTLPPKPQAKPAAQEPVVAGELKKIKLKPPIVVREFAIAIGLKPFKLISELMEMGIFASMNQTIDEATAINVAAKYGFELSVRHRGDQPKEGAKDVKEEKPEVDESKFLEPRPPVVCVLGHVDHGKTTLLDTIRKANVVSGEAGGITQHIGAYQVERKKQKITFIDTPGHAAFSKMRERGANVTDIAILVIAADDAFKPQTEEALKFAQNAQVPIVVAINKIDSKGANLDRVKQQMQERNIAPEEWGGDTLCVGVSALKGENIDELLEQVLLQAEMMELQANPKCPAEGVIVESQVEMGRGPTASLIVQKGTLKVGDAILCGGEYCKVRAMMNEHGEKLKAAPPSTPVKVLGWSGAPEAGAEFVVVKNEKQARNQAEEFATQEKRRQAAQSEDELPQDLDQLFSAINSAQEKVYKVILKGDVHGSVEALEGCLMDIKSDKVKLEVIGSSVGMVNKGDITTAHAAGGVAIVGFNTKVEPAAQALAKQNKVTVISHNIIYELIDQVKEGMAALLDPELVENKLGAAEVRQIFSVSKGAVAGCMVTEGKISRDAYANVLRGPKQEAIHRGKVTTLKRFKDDVGEVRAGYECGIQISGFNDYKEGDILECFEIQKVQPAL